ncbi:MAG: PEP-CTERM sorting domain-containing protein [Pseudomonadota bacterium]
MRHILFLLLGSLLFISLNASAFLISDAYLVEKQITIGTWEGHKFELIPAGYAPATDSITRIKIIYDFTEIMSPTNLGDADFFNEDDPEDLSIDMALYENEPATFHSWIFEPRAMHPDLDTGLTIFETSWTRNNLCQFEDEETRLCEYNIDMDGTMNAYVLSQSDNLWLHSIKVEVEIDRAEVPEPNSLLLLGVGLFAVGFLRKLKK